MRIAILAFFLGLPLLPLAIQDEGEQVQQEPRNAFTAFQEEESARLEKAVQGAWLLMDYQTTAFVIDPEDVRGFVMFYDGFMTLTLQAREESGGFFGTALEYTFQSGAYRYRIVDGVHLQVVGMIGFTNANEERELDFQAPLEPHEYVMTVADNELGLTRMDGRSFRFRKLERGEFTESSIDRLNRLRTGDFVDDERWMDDR